MRRFCIDQPSDISIVEKFFNLTTGCYLCSFLTNQKPICYSTIQNGTGSWVLPTFYIFTYIVKIHNSPKNVKLPNISLHDHLRELDNYL